MQLYLRQAHPQTTTPWNKGKLMGQKAPLKLKEIWAIRFRLQQSGRLRDIALFNLAIDSKLRGCDLVRLKVADAAQGGCAMSRATIIQRKTKQPVQFEITEQTRESIDAWISHAQLPRRLSVPQSSFAIPAHLHPSIRPLHRWVGIDDRFGPISLRYSLDAAHEADADIPAHKEPEGCAASPWSHKT